MLYLAQVLFRKVNIGIVYAANLFILKRNMKIIIFIRRLSRLSFC